MESKKEKLKKFKLKGNESFNIREGWLRKGLKELKKNPALFSTDDAMLDLGVGSKMVKAIKYWLLATGLVEEKYAKNKREYFATEDCGEIISEYDPYFEDIFTLYVLHSNIVRNKELCIVWHLFFNNFEAQDFTREDVYQVLKHELDKAIEQGVTYSDSLLKDDCYSLIRMYVKDMKETADPEEDLGSPFEALGFISPNELKSGRYLKTTPRYGKIDKLAILYVMRKNMKEGKDSVSITELLKEPNNIGKTFNLGRAVINEYLDELRLSGFITINRTAGLDMVYFAKDITPGEILKRYYTQG